MTDESNKTQYISEQRKKYKLGGGVVWKIKLIIGFLFFTTLCYFLSDIFLSDDIEWHLYSKTLGPVIPNIYMKILWYSMLCMSLFVLIQLFIPYSSIIIDNNNISVQNFFTRRFKTAPLSEIADININKHRIKVFSLNNGNIEIPIRMLTKKDFFEIRTRIYNSINLT